MQETANSGKRRGRPPKVRAEVSDTAAAACQTNGAEAFDGLDGLAVLRFDAPKPEPPPAAFSGLIPAENPAQLLCIIARLAAADVLHTAEKPATVLKRAIAEGKLAAKLLAEELAATATGEEADND